MSSNRETKQSFISLVGMQTQNAFNDKVAQFLIIPLSYWLTQNQLGSHEAMPHILAILLVAPFLLLAPVAGWLSDKYSKVLIIRRSALLQTIILLAMCGAAYMQSLLGLVCCFCILAIQSVILSPAKRGVIKELVGTGQLGGASGVMEISVVLAVCIGQILASATFAILVGQGKSGWQAVAIPLFYLWVATFIPLFLSYRIRETEVVAKQPPKLQIFGHFGQLKELWKTLQIRRMAVAKALFWGYAGVLNLWQIALARQVAEMSDMSYGGALAKVMLVASIGVVSGGAIASWVSRKAIQQGLLLMGLGGMIGSTLCLFFASTGSLWMYISLWMAGFAGAAFLVPVNGQLQDLLPAERRGRLLAASSILDCGAGLGAVLLQLIWTCLDISIAQQSLLLGGGLLVAFWFYLRHYSRSTINLLAKLLMTMLYRLRVDGLHHLPKSGGVLLTPNHVSYIDTLILTAACNRSIRFLMIEDCFATPGVGWFARYADTIPISRTKAKDAIKSAADALKEGSVVCIFPEGQLTRTGGLSQLKRGFELIARQAQSPVLPVYMDGLWGSIFSFDQEKVLWKMPRPQRCKVRVLFGKCLEGKQNVSMRRLAESYFELSANAFDKRAVEQWEKTRRKVVRYGGIPKELRQELRELSQEDFCLYLRNALQLSEFVVFKVGERFGVYLSQSVKYVIALLSFEKRGRLVRLSKGEEVSCDHYFLSQGERNSSWKGGVTYMIGADPLEAFEGDATAYPIVVKGGIVVALSAPDPKKIKPTDQGQSAWKLAKRGKVLPGSSPLPVEADSEFFI